MGALAAWTDRVRLLTTVIVPQLHNPVMLAKAGVALVVTQTRGATATAHRLREVQRSSRLNS